VGAGVAIGGHFIPSALVLGQWSSMETLGSLVAWRVPGADSGRVAVTFDDGPDPLWTPRVLDRLDELGWKERGWSATFFVIGSRISPGSPEADLVEEIQARGHEVGLHGFRHERHFFHLPPWVREDLSRGCEVLEDLGCTPRFFRPPYGIVSAATLLEAKRHQMSVVLWSAWGREWTDKSPASVANRLSRRLSPGAIVLLHDSEATAPPGTVPVVLETLPLLDEMLRERGLLAGPLAPRVLDRQG